MKDKHLLSYAYAEALKTNIKKMQRIEDELVQAIETLKNAIDTKDEKIDELNKKIEELEKSKKAVKNRAFNCIEVNFSRVSGGIMITAIVNMLPELYSICKEDLACSVNGNRYYLEGSEMNGEYITTAMVSCEIYELEKAQKIAERLLNNDIYGNIKAQKGDNDNEHNVR